MSLEDIQQLPEIVKIDGLELKVEFDFNAIANFERKSGMSVYKAKELILNGELNLSDQVILLHSGLLKHQPKFKFETLTNRADIGIFLQSISDPVMDAFFRPLLPPEIYEKIKMPELSQEDLKKNQNLTGNTTLELQ
jgi:hypothetical protein